MLLTHSWAYFKDYHLKVRGYPITGGLLCNICAVDQCQLQLLCPAISVVGQYMGGGLKQR